MTTTTQAPARRRGADGSIYSGPDYATGAVIRFAEWSTGVDTYERYTASVAYVMPRLTSDDIARATREARKLIRAAMTARGDSPVGGSRLPLTWQADVDASGPRTVIVLRFWEV